MTEPPVRTPAGSAKSLQLTPIWEEVVRNHRVPAGIAESEILREIRGRLRSGEWEVRQHALRVLSDVLPVTGDLVEAGELQAALVSNLGSPAPGVRRAAREALGKLVQHIKDPEENILGLLGGCNDENVTLGMIIALPDLLKPLIIPQNGNHMLSIPCLIEILTYLVNKVPTPIYRDASVDTLIKIRDLCGESKFQRCLDEISPDPKTLQLLTLNLDDSGIDLKLPTYRSNNLSNSKMNKSETNWSDFSDNDTEENLQNSVTTYHNYGLIKRDVSSEDMGSDGSDDTYTMESTESGKVVLETEIRFSEEKAITMRIMEDDSQDINEGCEGKFVSADGALVMAVIPSSDEDARRTPRRVRFGGEVVKLCTPDSDATDVRIEIQDAPEHAVERMVLEKSAMSKPSQIPLPVAPSTTLPQAPAESPRLLALNLAARSSSTKENDFHTSQQKLLLPSIQVEGVDSEPSQNSSDIENSLLSSESQQVVPSSPLPKTSVNISNNENFQLTQPTSSSDPPKTSNVERPRTANSRDRLRSDTPDLNPSPNTQDFATDLWAWQSLRLLNETDMETLRNKDDWKEELPILEQLPRNLLSGDVQERLQTANVDILRGLFRYLLDYSRPQTANAALAAVQYLIESIPDDTAKACLPELVSGVSRHVGGSSAVAVKMAATNIIMTLFSRQTPSDILDILLSQRCLHSPSSKMRENSLLVLLHGLVTFPSTTFPQRRLLQEACQSAADPRRRVRHAALETLAVLAQYLSSKDIIDCASKFGDSRLVSGVSTRLTRRSLPSVSPDGLVLYALQIPSARRIGNMGPPQGPDVDWILAGTGSLSTGSARSRGQLQASRWGADSNIVRKSGRENPWTAQKHRTEDALAWALVPVSQLDDSYSGVESGYVTGMRPLYVKLAASEESLRSPHYAVHRVADTTPTDNSIRVLTPSVLRKRPESKLSLWSDNRSREADDRMERVVGRKVLDAPRPVLVSTSPINHSNTPPAALFLPNIHHPEKNKSDRSTLSYGTQNDHSPDKPRMAATPSSADKTRFFESSTAQLATLAANSQSLSQSLPAVVRSTESASSIRPHVPSTHDSEDTISLNNETSQEKDKLFRSRERNLGLEQRVSMASAPAAITNPVRETSSSSSTTDSVTMHTAYSPHRSSDPLEVTSISYRSINDNYNQKVKAKRKLLATNHTNGPSNKVASNTTQFPDTLKPFDRPKEGLDMCFTQLDATQWEVTVQGLTSLVRLIRHHPNVACAHIHALVGALARHIRNLRSQVSRAACVVAGEMFTNLKRSLEPELEELAGALFHRVADTNRFIRADSNAALDCMVDTTTPQKSVTVILSKGAAHLNAVVRTSAARLLLRLTEKLGPEKMLALPKDIRDKMLQSSASLLTEGRLETRSFAKHLFRILSTQPEFGNIILEAIPTNIMRQISKTLASLRP